MAIECSTQVALKINFEALKKYIIANVKRFQRNIKFDFEGIDDWNRGLETDISYVMVSLRGAARNSLSLQVLNEHQIFNNFEAISALFFVEDYEGNVTRLDGSRNGPVFLRDNAFAISDCLAAGRFNNARTLHGQAVKLLGQRAYEEQEIYAADLELAKDPVNEVRIIPQRLFAFVHELMGQRAGQDRQPWDRWDIVPDADYVAAARAVYTQDMDEAAQTVCTLCNLHVQYSNPFPEGNEDDQLSGFEFDTPVRAIWPTEIFAWLRLRQERGLPLPEVAHPLLEQPLGRFDPAMPSQWEYEPWFVELVQKLATFQPRYADLPQRVFENP